MSSLNKVSIIGNLGADPEVRRMSSGDPVVNLRVACTDSWKDKNSGERKERTEWISVVIFNEGLAKVAEAYLRKGSKVYLEGSLMTRKWQDQSGSDRYTTEVVLQKFRGEMVLLDGPKQDQDSRTAAPAKQESYGQQSGGGSMPDFDDEQIPFGCEWR